MWIIYAVVSAFFAGVTSILAKCGIRKTNSNVATAIRTVVILFFAWLMVLITGSINRWQWQCSEKILTLSRQEGESRAPHPLFLFVIGGIRYYPITSLSAEGIFRGANILIDTSHITF